MGLPKLASLLLVLATGGLAACSSGGGESPDDFAPVSDDQIVSSTNAMGLRLQFDDVSGHVRATVRSKLLSGEKLVMRVRRGRLVVGADQTLDCSMLADAPALPPKAGASASAKIVYDGPDVDRSMLVSVYSAEWITANISADVLDRLSRDGSDTIVEACIVPIPQVPEAGAVMAAPVSTANTGARLRISTSIQDAWDSTDPHAAPELRARNRAAAAAAR